jgi:hypothetical protein
VRYGSHEAVHLGSARDFTATDVAGTLSLRRRDSSRRSETHLGGPRPFKARVEKSLVCDILICGNQDEPTSGDSKEN